MQQLDPSESLRCVPEITPSLKDELKENDCVDDLQKNQIVRILSDDFTDFLDIFIWSLKEFRVKSTK